MSYDIQIHTAFITNDFEALSKLAKDTAEFPDCYFSDTIGYCLQYAIFHSSISFIQKLLTEGSDPNYKDHDGFPSIIATLSSERKDAEQVIDLLLKHGADIHQRGVNDWTPLHFAAANDDTIMVNYILKKGGNPNLRTRIDNYATPLEEARILDCTKAIKVLKPIHLS